MSIPYIPFSKAVIRIPNFPVKKFKQLILNTESLKLFCQQKNFQEALYIASPELHTQMVKWLNGLVKQGKEQDKLKQSLYRYIARMSTRSTPFGLFAGLVTVNLNGTNNKKALSNTSANNHRVTRIDMNYACALGQYFSTHTDIKSQLKFYANNSIYQVGQKLRYVEYTYGKKSRRMHRITAIDNSPYVNRILKHAKNGGLIKELASTIVEQGITFNEALGFVNELISDQILVSELEPSITEPDYWGFLRKKLDKLDSCSTIVKNLKQVENILSDLDKKPTGVKVDDYYGKVKAIIDKFKVSYDGKYLFQTDMLIYNIHGNYNIEIANRVLDGMDILNRLSMPLQASNITKFTEEFNKRYEEREVSLLSVLDPETGLGYPVNSGLEADMSPLIDDLALPGKEQGNSQINWNRVQAFLLKKYQQSLKNKDFSIELSHKELKGFDMRYDDLPSTISAMVQLLPAEKKGKEDRILFSSVGGNSALCLIGRFCHTNKELNAYANNIADKEKELAGKAIVAEIVHLPEARTGNILMHPKFYEYEIPYLAQPSVNKDHAIELSDLMISVRQNRVLLRSKRLNKQIIPRLSNAHNYSFNALPVYQFLCDMQLQGKRESISFNWGAFANEYSFLPRVTFKNLIFSLATWNIKIKDIEHLLKIKQDKELLKGVDNWCVENRIPQWVTLADGDNELAIDMKSVLSIKTLLDLVKNRGAFKLQEFLHNHSFGPVKDTKGNVFANQLIISFYKQVKLETSVNE